jgi:hypothetical protein
VIRRIGHYLAVIGLLPFFGWGLTGCDVIPSALLQGGAGSSELDDGAGQRVPDEVEAGDGLEPGQGIPTSGVINARVRNLTDQFADVTLRFLLRDVVVRLTFIRVPARTSTTIVGPELADFFEANGQFQDGSPLPGAVFRFGIDFDAGTEALYLIGEAAPGENVAPSLAFLNAIGDIELDPGDSFEVTINDEDPDSAARIQFLLDPDEQPLNGNEISLADDLPEEPDGQADTFELTIPLGAAPGRYFLLGAIRDELSTDIVQAAGSITIRDPNAEPPVVDVSPTINIIEPSGNVEILLGEMLHVSWTDADPDSSAQISLYLDPDDAPLDGDEVQLRTGLSEDSDGAADSAAILLAEDVVPPGSYRVLGVIADGVSTSTAVSAGVVTVIRPTENRPPSLTILQPSSNVTVTLGETLFVSWEDDDEEDNAEINFFLDANGIDLDGGEVFIRQFFEDQDGPGFDDAQIAIIDVAPGVYDLLGVSFDGESFGIDRAAGRVTVLAQTPPPGGGGGGGGGGGDPSANCGTSDFNMDGVVNLRDFAAFQNCFVGADQACRCTFDINLNNEVDGIDYIELFLLIIGEG